MKGQREWEQIAVKDMPHPPYSFSENPAPKQSMIVPFMFRRVTPALYAKSRILRQKIQHIIATQVGEPDEMCPQSLAETRYWCVVRRTKTEAEMFKSLGFLGLGAVYAAYPKNLVEAFLC